MDPNGTGGGGGGSSSSAAAATAAAWNYAANPQNYANPAVTSAAAAHQNYGNAQTAQNYASAINWWQQQAQAHAQQLAQQQAQASQTQQPQESDSPPLQQQQPAQPPPQPQQQQQQQQSSSQGSTPTSQSSSSQQQLSNMNMYQYNQQLLQYQYQQLQSANYQHHTGGAANFTAATAGAMTPATYNDKPTPARRPSGSPVGKGSKRKRKDPNRPKRPTSAYFFFVSGQRKLCEERGEKITRVAEWTKEISAVWRALTPEEKVQYDEKAAIDKARYNSEMGRYKNKDPNRPKRPMSAYFLWLGDFRCKMKDKIPENKELLRAAGRSWKEMTEDEKAPYDVRAEEERRKYEAKMREYSQVGAKTWNDGQDSHQSAGLPVKRPKPEPEPVSGSDDDDVDEPESPPAMGLHMPMHQQAHQPAHQQPPAHQPQPTHQPPAHQQQVPAHQPGLQAAHQQPAHQQAAHQQAAHQQTGLQPAHQQAMHPGMHPQLHPQMLPSMHHPSMANMMAMHHMGAQGVKNGEADDDDDDDDEDDDDDDDDDDE